MPRRTASIIPGPSAVPVPTLNLFPVGPTEIDVLAALIGRADVKLYQIQFAPTQNGPWSDLIVAQPNQVGNGLFVIHNALTSGATLFYRARVTYKTGRQSLFSPVASASTTASLRGIAASDSIAAGVLGNPSGTGARTKYHPGNYFWWDNQFWPGNQQPNYNAHINSLLADPLITGTQIVLTMAKISDPTLTNGKQTFTGLRSILDPILAKARTRVGSAFYVTLKFWQVFFNTQSVTDTGDWPQWVINKGNWLKAVTDVNGGKRVQLDFDNPAVWAALTEMHAGVGDLYDSDPNFAMYATSDESDAVSVQQGGGTVLNSVNYQAKWLQMHLDIKAHWPSTPVWVTYNFLPPGDGTIPNVMSNQITALRQAYPGGFCFGGPDPFVRGTTFQKIAAGTAGTLGDVRGEIMLVNHIEEVFLGNSGNPPTKPTYSPDQIYANAVDINKCQYLIWNYETWEYYKAADQIAAIHARNGATAAAPTEGVFDQTSGVHA